MGVWWLVVFCPGCLRTERFFQQSEAIGEILRGNTMVEVDAKHFIEVRTVDIVHQSGCNCGR